MIGIRDEPAQPGPTSGSSTSFSNRWQEMGMNFRRNLDIGFNIFV